MRVEILAFVLFAECNPAPVPPTPPEFSCGTACETLRELKCPEAESTLEGGTCEDVCENSFVVGIPEYSWDVEQVTKLEACEGGS